MLEAFPSDSYKQLQDSFSWDVPGAFNIATVCADRHPCDDVALIMDGQDGTPKTYTFGELTRYSRQFASALVTLGLTRGDRIAVVLPQRVEAGVAHLASYRLGAVAVPLSPLFGPEALAYRIGNSGARAVITDTRHLNAVQEAAATLPDVHVVVTDPVDRSDIHDFWQILDAGDPDFPTAKTGSDDPALLIYTSGTTGPPKGALHGHRVLLGHLPGFELMYDQFPRGHDRTWTPADWAWIGGLLDLLLPTWYHGRPVVGTTRTSGFDAHWAADVIRRNEVTAAFLPPSALRLMRQADVDLTGSSLRAVMSGGESLGAEMLAWCQDHLGLEPNEIYGQTEANLIVGNSRHIWPVRPGSMGRPYPGHDVQILDESGEVAPVGQIGQIAVRMPDPVSFLGYWGNPDATARKTQGGWVHTGDLGKADEDGYLWFVAREDDVINSAGYRIGPAEIESCICTHPQVINAAAIGVADPLRGQVVKAFVVLADGVAPSEQLADEIRRLVRSRLAAYEYPRQIEFVSELPTTTTGKLRRSALHEHADH